MNRSVLLLVGAVLAFALCFLEGLGVVSGVDYDTWLAGGLLALAASLLP